MSSIARRRRWTKWLTRKPASVQYHRTLRFEELESRLAPATFTWSGAGTNNNWSTGANWIGGVAPSGIPAAGDELVFPAGAARLTNVDDIANGTFNAITVSGAGYTLNATAGNTMTLGQGGLSGSGTFVVNAGASATLAIDTVLGAPGSSTQSFTVESGATLTVSSKLSGTTGTTLAKGGPGTMSLLNDNSGFTGPIRLLPAGGIMIVSHPLALGTTSNSTTVGTNATLRISNAAGMTINEPLFLNGLGLSNDGALNNVLGSNVWAGTITLDTNAAIGASGGVLSITGVISDTGAGHDLTKEGPGEIQFNSPSGNTYRGLTTINHGILTIAHPLALGSAGTPANGTIVNEDLTRAGRLQISDPSGVGFTILNEQLTLNGDGEVGTITNNDRGALRNAKGDNTWAGPVILGSPSPVVVNHVNIGVAAGTNLTISGVVSSPNQPGYTLRKRETGRLILNNHNTYGGSTLIQQGIVNIRDSRALGEPFSSSTTVSNGAALELEVEAGNPALLRFDPQGRDLWDDSVTHQAHELNVSETLFINGRGVGNTGALHSITGINIYTASILLAGVGVNVENAIGVDQDPRPGHPTPDNTYFISDYSLTALTIPFFGSNPQIGDRANTLVKRGTGHLILPNANGYFGDTKIEQGWVTIQNSNSLGGRPSNLGDTVQPPTFVENGAALHIRPLTDASPPLVIPENITLEGVGPDHPYAFIGKKGALMNLGGDNTWRGDITLTGQVGIGVEQLPNTTKAGTVDGFSSSDLLVTGSIKEGGSSQIFSFQASGGPEEFSQILNAGATSGTVTIDYDMLTIPDTLKVYYPPRAQGGTAIINTGSVSSFNTVSASFGPGPSTQIEVVVNEGGSPNPGTAWFLDRVEIQTTKAGGGFLKYGSRRLTLQGDGTYQGNSDILEGTALVENDTGLGRSSSGTFTTSEAYSQTDTRVATGAVLQLDANLPLRNGGIESGLQVWDERLLLNSPGQQIAVAGAVAPLIGRYRLSYDNGTSVTTTRELFITATPQQVQDAINQDLTNLPGVSAVVTRSGNVYTVVFSNALGVARAPDVNLLQVTGIADGAEVRISGSNAQVVNVSHDNTWRGPVVLESHARVFVNPDSRLNLLGAISDDPNDAAGDDFVKRGTGELALGGANTFRGITGIDQGIVNVMNSSAFGATTGGTVVANGAQLQLQGNLTIAGEPLTIQGTGPGVTPDYDERWLNLGAATTNNGTSGANLPTSGRITGVATDPSDPNVIYIAAAGGGVWKSKNGGLTWLHLFDETVDPQAALYGGSVYVAPSNPHVVYFATGEANGRENGQPIAGQTDNYAGTGVYKSTDDGLTWTLLTSPGGINPLFGQGITKLIVDPENPNRIYVASGTSNLINANPNAVPGIYRYDGTNTWVNLTGNPSAARQTIPTTVAPVSPGPDDDFRITFPQTNATWSDILLIKRGEFPQLGGTSEWVLYAALGESRQAWYTGTTANQQAVLNGVYRTEDPDTVTNPTWWLGQGTIYPRTDPRGPALPPPPFVVSPPTMPDGRGTSFPVGPVTPPNPAVPPPGRNGWIKLAGTVTEYYTLDDTIPTTGRNRSLARNALITVYASIAKPDWDPFYGELLEIQKSGFDGGINTNWAATGSVPNLPFGQAVRNNPSLGTFNDNLIPALGRYDHTLLVQDSDPRPNALSDNDPNIVYLGGKDSLFRSTDGGATWSAIPPDSNGIYPSHGFHALHQDTSGRLLTGTDGGIWRMNTASLSFQDLNGSLSITQYNSVDPHPTDFRQAYGGAQDNGTQYFNNSQAWTRVDDASGLNTGIVRFDPSNPNIAYAVRDGLLRKTTDGGATWTTILNVTDTTAFPNNDRDLARNYFPLVVDRVNPNRVLVGGAGFLLLSRSGSLFESILGGTPRSSFIDLRPPISPTAIGIATFQGLFQPDTDFTTVTDKLSNTYDPDTIYVTNGTQIWLTKNHGVKWVDRTPFAFVSGTAILTDITVDPSNRDIVYVTLRYSDGRKAATVLRSKDAGKTWTDISGNLEGLQTWKIVIDPRDDSAYIGNDDGVFKLDDASTVVPGSITWQRFGDGMPHVQVKDLVLSQSLNTLTAATYGRGIQQLFLTDYESNAGALRVVSGSSVWTGPITLTGDTTIGVAGTQNIQNGIAAASLNIIGSISDNTPGANHGLIKIGPGTATLSGTNTYGGQTQVLEGVLQVNNPNALGAATQSGNTVVQPTSIDGRPALAALELRSDLEAEPITINGRGFEFNDHFTGALRNVSNDNTYTGPLTFGTDTTIGVDSNTTLTIGELVGLAGEGTITDNPFGFDKESPGTLVLASGNKYDGLTRVVQGALRVEHEFALGDIGVGTEVLDGAQLQISRRLDVSGATVTPVETVVTGEPLTLSGTGIFGTGALLNVRGDSDPSGTNNNKWQGPITFTIDPNFAPPTNPGSQIAVGASDPRDVLTLDTVLREGNTPFAVQFGLIKVGPGVLALSQANQYTGVTNVNEGSLRVQHSSALGPPVSSEVQTINVFGVGNYRLQFTNSSGTILTTALISASAPDPLTAATTLRQRLEAILGVGNVFVSATANLNGFVFHVTFGGTLANTNVSQLVATSVSSGLSVGITTPQQGGTGTIVANGASLETDGTLGPVTVSEVLTLNGDGVNGAGALNNVFGTNVYSGPITLATDTSLGALGNSELIVTGVVQDTPNPSAPPVPAPRLRKAGDGIVTFPDAKPYGGLTDVARGVLRISDELALGTIRNEVQKIQVSSTGGTLRLTFDGQQTGLMLFPYSAPQIEAALEALSNIDDVSVTEASDGLGGKLFTVTFLGNQGNRNVPQMTATVSGATNAVITTFQNGQEGTVVRSGATLQIDGPLVMTSESVTINGPGFNNQGALNGFVGDNIWATPLILGSDASIGTTSATDDLFFPLPITDRNPLTGLSQGFDLDVVGPGTVHFDAAGDNQYTGTTTVKQGTLLLNHSGGIAILGPLVVGDGGAIPALVRELQTNQVADTSPVTVNSNGTFDLNTLTDTIDKLTVNGGLVVTGAGGDLVTADVAMTGGKVTIGDGGTLNSKNVAMAGGLIEVGFGSKATVLDVNMKAGAAITLANTAELHGGKVTMDASKITGQDNVVVAIGDLGMTAGSGITLGNTAKLTAGAVTMESSTLTFGTDAVAKVLDIGMTKGSAIAFGDRGNFQGGKLTMDASAFTAGKNAVLNLGAVTISGAGSLTVGDLGQVTTGDIAISGQSAMNVGANGQVTGGAVALDDGDITLGAFTTAKVSDISMKAGSSLGVGNNGKLESGDVTMAGSDITINDGGQLLGGDLTMDASKVTAGTGTTLTLGAVGMTAGSQVQVGGTSQVTAGAVSLDASSISLGASTTAKVLGVDMKATSSISVGDGGTLKADGVTMAGSSLSVGNSGQLNALDVTLTGSTITLGFGSLSTVGNINQTGGSIDLGPVGTLTALDVTVNGGTVSLGVSATANTQDVDLTGSAVNLASGSTLFLGGDVTAISTATAGSFINGPGTLNLKGIARTFAANDGPQNDDLTVSALVVPGGAVDVIKTGAGRLAVTNTTVATGVDLLAGEMQVNGGASVGPVEIGGGTLSGTGTVGTIDGPGTGTAVNGIVSPGVSYLPNSAGILTSGTAVWGPTTTFMVDLASSTPGSPAPGTDYDQLVVNGSIDVTGAKLVGLVGDGIELNDRYTIIRTVGGTVTGTFARPNGYNTDVIFVAGFKFNIDYSDPTKVDLVKVLATTTTTIVTSVNPSTINQPVTFTATVTPEKGVIDTTPVGQPLVPLTSTVTFFIDGIATATINVGADTTAVYTPTPPNPPLSGGSHTIVATYNGDPDLLAMSSSSPLTQVVEVPVIDDLAGSPAFISPNNSPGVQDQFTIATTVRSERSDETTWTIEIRDSLNNVVRTISGIGVIDDMTGNTFPINADWDGKDGSGNFVPDGIYSIITTFVDEWNNTGTTPAISVVVDNTNPTADPLVNEHRVIAPGTASTVFETSTLTSTVADTNLTGWTVTIFDELDNPVRSFTGTGTAVSFLWDGKDDGGAIVSDGEYTASLTVSDAAGNTTTTATVSVVVLTQGPSVTLTSNTPTVYGDDVNLTATVSVPFASVSDLLDGDTIEFFLGTTSLGTGTLSLVGGQFQASLTVPFVLDAGTYSNLTASYIGTEDFLPSTSPQYTHEVKPAILRITADNKTKVYGDPIPALTFVATGFVAGDTQAEVLTGGLATPATPASGVGTYPILQGSLVSNGNYTVILTPGTLTVTPASLTIQIDDLERPLFSPNPPLTATFIGLVAGDTPAVVSGLNLTTTATPESALGTYPITATGTPTAANYTIQVIPGVLSVTPIPTSFAIGSGPGTPGRVNFYSPGGSLGLSLAPFGDFDGGVRVATGDFNRDGIEDLAVGTGPGVQARVIVLSGLDNSQLFSIFPFEDFSGGVFVAAGDITGDGVAELVITPDEGGGPRVTVRRGGDFAALVDYFGIDDPNFRGGVRAGVGDINADGFGDVVLSAGFGGGPRISVWDGKFLSSVQFRNLMGDFFAFDSSLRNGAYVSVGDVNGDGFGDIIAGAGPGGAPHIKVFSGSDLLTFGPGSTQEFATFFAGDPGNRGGVRVAGKDLDGDGFIDLLTGPGDSNDVVTAYRGSSLAQGGSDVLFTNDPFDGILNGVFVG